MTEEIEEKTERLVRLCAEKGLSGILLNSQPNFSWLTAGGTNGVDLSREAGVATLLVRSDGKRLVLANRIEVGRIMTEELDGQGYEPVEFGWEDESANPLLVVELARRLTTNSLPLGSDAPMEESALMLEGEIERLRYKLADAEVDRFRHFGKDAGNALGEVARVLLPELTERDIARRVNDALAAIGAHPIVTLVAADERLARFRHPVPTERPWKTVLMIVVCARRNGLVVSLTRILCAGAVPEDLSRRTRAAASVNAKLFAATKPGASGRELYRVAADEYRQQGFSGEEKLHHQGGAAGYRTRDWVAHPNSNDVVSEKQAFAWNPSITGTKVEETCIAFAEGIEVITATPGWPTIPVAVEGREYLLPDILPV